MNLTRNDIESAKVWAQMHAGDDDPLDVFEYKLLAIGKVNAEKSARHHLRDSSEAQARMVEIENLFVVAGPTDEDAFGEESF